MDVRTGDQPCVVRSNLDDNSSSIGEPQRRDDGQVTGTKHRLDRTGTEPHRAPIGDRPVANRLTGRVIVARHLAPHSANLSARTDIVPPCRRMPHKYAGRRPRRRDRARRRAECTGGLRSMARRGRRGRRAEGEQHVAKGAMTSINQRIADELGVREGQVTAAVELLDGGATVPFIARYRKEVTGTLDDQQLRTLEERLGYLRELEERRAAVLESIRSQGKLDDALEQAILAADSKARLEDIYLPYKPKRRTKAQIAREAGLEPLADQLLGDPALDPRATATAFVDADKGVADEAAALDGARAIL